MGFRVRVRVRVTRRPEDRQATVSMTDVYLSVWVQGRTRVGLTNARRRDPWGNYFIMGNFVRQYFVQTSK